MKMGYEEEKNEVYCYLSILVGGGQGRSQSKMFDIVVIATTHKCAITTS